MLYSAFELLTNPLLYSKSIENDKKVTEFAKSQRQVLDFFDKHLSPYVLARCFSHPLLRVQLLAFVAAKDPQAKSALVNMLFQPANHPSRLTAATWLGAIAFLADGDAEFMSIIKTGTYPADIQTAIARYDEDPNFYFAYALYESFFRAFRIPALDLTVLDSAVAHSRVHLPNCTPPDTDGVTPLHVKYRPWIILDISIERAVHSICRNYSDALDYYLKHFNEMHLNFHTPAQLLEVCGSLTKHYPIQKTSTDKIQIVFEHVERCIQHFKTNNISFSLTNVYFYKLFLLHGISLLKPNTPYPNLRSLFIELIANEQVFARHFETINASHENLQSAMVAYFKSGDIQELLAFLDEVELDAINSISTQIKKPSIQLVLKHYSEEIAKHETRYINLLMYSVMNDLKRPTQLDHHYCTLFVEKAVNLAIQDHLKSRALLKGVLAQLRVTHLMEFHLMCLTLLQQQCNLLNTQPNTLLIKELLIQEVAYKDFSPTFFALILSLAFNHTLSPDPKIEYLRHVPNARSSIEAIQPSVLQLMIDSLKSTYKQDCELFTALNTLATDHEKGVEQLEVLAKKDNKIIAERALHELIQLTLTGDIGYDEELEIKEPLPDFLQSNSKHAIYALLHVCKLDLTKPINAGIFNHVIDMLAGNLSNIDDIKLKSGNTLPRSVAKNIYHFYHHLECAGVAIPIQLKQIQHQYILQLENNVLPEKSSQPFIC